MKFEILNHKNDQVGLLEKSKTFYLEKNYEC